MNPYNEGLQAETNEDVYTFQVRRMRHMKAYPKNEDTEWIEIARKYAPSTLALCDAISQLIEECPACPSCAELKTALIARKPDPEPEWRHTPQPAPEQSAYTRFFQENEQIMERARQKERETKEKDQRVKQLLGIHDFLVVSWPQRFWAERELGYPVTASQNQEINDWLNNLNRDPKVVIGQDSRNREELRSMFGIEGKR